MSIISQKTPNWVQSSYRIQIRAPPLPSCVIPDKSFTTSSATFNEGNNGIYLMLLLEGLNKRMHVKYQA